jgi:hypothetical protein
MSWSSPKPLSKNTHSDFIQITNGTNHENSESPIKNQASNPNESQHKSLAFEIVKTIKNFNLKLIAFDFDQTIVSIHTGGIWPDSAEKLAEFVRPCFLHLIPELLKCDSLFICIVTFSSQENLIRDVLRISLPYIPTNQINKILIKGNTKLFIDKYGLENCFSNGKQLHLNFCKEYLEDRVNSLKILNKDILLIDDDTENIEFARQAGHLAFQVNKNVSLHELHQFLLQKNVNYCC